MNINELLKIVSKKIGTNESHLLLESILKKDRKYLIINSNEEVDEDKEKECIKFARKIEKGYPIQYILNKAYFMGLEFYVDKNVLIPQPDTEIVVESALKEINRIQNEGIKNRISILDLCTGSGCIAVSLCKMAENIDITATDISYKALKIARKNYNEICKNTTNNISFVRSDMFNKIKNKYDIIISNPPYIESNMIKNLNKDVKREPHIALNGGKDGIKFYKIIKQNVNKYLKDNGTLILEIGYNQRKIVQALFEESDCIKDFANNDRVIIWRKK